jgi:hypothetical protein
MKEDQQHLIKRTINDPDSMSDFCDDHVFYLKEFEVDEETKTLLVYAKKQGERYEVECSGWLKKLKL